MEELSPPLDDALRQRLSAYLGNPCSYADEFLRQSWWGKQKEIADALVTHRKVLVMAATGVGKTHACGGIAQYWTDVAPGIAYTTAPTWAQVERLLWKEIRVQRPRKSLGMLAPRAPELRYAPDHFCIGVNAEQAESLQGQHHERLLFLLDEAPGVQPWFWLVADRLCVAPENRILAIGNPFLPSGPFYEASLSEDWYTITISAMDHPNVLAGLAGLPEPYPGAVGLVSIDEAVKAHCEPGSAGYAGHIEWRPGSGNWWRPDAEFEARVLGRFPTESTATVIPVAWFEDSLSELARRKPDGECVLGIDVARFGDDRTEFHVRKGRCSLYHYAMGGADTIHVSLKAKEIFERYKCDKINVLITGLGGGVYDTLRSYKKIGECVCGIDEGGRSRAGKDRYINVRNEMWFLARDSFHRREFDLSRLDKETVKSLRYQLCSPMYEIDTRGRRVIEKKDEMKKRVGRSPDGADAFLASHYPTRKFDKQEEREQREKPMRAGIDYGKGGY